MLGGVEMVIVREQIICHPANLTAMEEEERLRVFSHSNLRRLDIAREGCATFGQPTSFETARRKLYE